MNNIRDDKDKAAFEKWQNMKEQGKKKFIFRIGFLMYGMTLLFIYIISIVIISITYNPEIGIWELVSSGQFLKRLLSAFILFGLMGWFMGRSIWRSYQRRWDEVSKF